MSRSSYPCPPLVAMGILLGSCGTPADVPVPDEPSVVSAPTKQRSDTLVVARKTDLGSLLSVVSEASSDREIINAISVPLVSLDFDCSFKKSPGFGEEWNWSQDGTTLSMTLRNDIVFEDGTPVTAKDLAFTFELLSDPTVTSPHMSYAAQLTATGRPRVVDDTHVEWVFNKAYDRDTQIGHLSEVAITPHHRLMDAERTTLRDHALAKQPLSYGPWRLEEYVPNETYTLVPNDNFSGPPQWSPSLNRVLFRIIPDYATRILELRQGGVDVVTDILVEDADVIRNEHPEIRLMRRGWRSTDSIAWNLNHPLFSDPRVRRALTLSINIDEMIETLFTDSSGEAYARPSVGTISPALCGVYNDQIATLPFDAAGSRALLAEAGWTDSNGDGIVDREGTPFLFTLTTNSGDKRRADTALLIQQYLLNVGVKMEIEFQETNTFFENTRLKKFQAALLGWSADLFVDPTSIWHSDTPDHSHEFNMVGYSNPRADELIAQGLATVDPREAAAIWKDLQAVIYADQPYTFLWWTDKVVGVHERFENAQVNMLSSLHNLHEWSVPPDKVKYSQ